MSEGLILLLLVVLTALAFDFTNGFHDTANAMAPSIATGALSPKAAVTLSAILNLVGAFISVEVALTVTNGVIRIQNADGSPRVDLTAHGGEHLLLILLAGLVGGIMWNLFTWMRGLPSSSSHALFGGLVGAVIAGIGPSGVKWIGDGSHVDGVIGKVIVPGLLSPVATILVASIATWLVFRVTRGIAEHYAQSGFRWGQIGSASLMSLSHGTNDAQKTMGIITLALIANGEWTSTESIPLWVKILCAGAIAIGTYIGGWRIIRTMGKGLTDITPAQGMAADCSSAAVILTASHFGFALSTTHVATGSILGTGLGHRSEVRWGVAGRMLIAWIITFPCAAIMGALMLAIAKLLGDGTLGGIVITALLCLSAWLLLRHASKQPVNASNVNETWSEGIDPTRSGATRRSNPKLNPPPNPPVVKLDHKHRSNREKVDA